MYILLSLSYVVLVIFSGFLFWCGLLEVVGAISSALLGKHFILGGGPSDLCFLLATAFLLMFLMGCFLIFEVANPSGSPWVASSAGSWGATAFGPSWVANVPGFFLLASSNGVF